jgi:hypothetical protein
MRQRCWWLVVTGWRWLAGAGWLALAGAGWLALTGWRWLASAGWLALGWLASCRLQSWTRTPFTKRDRQHSGSKSTHCTNSWVMDDDPACLPTTRYTLEPALNCSGWLAHWLALAGWRKLAAAAAGCCYWLAGCGCGCCCYWLLLAGWLLAAGKLEGAALAS